MNFNSKLITDKASWLADRKNGIGGSDASVVMGLSPWKSRLTLWSEKVGLIPDADLSANEAVEWGNLLESPVAQKFERNHPEFTVCECDSQLSHVAYPWMTATVDRLLHNETGLIGGLEVKTVGLRGAEEWEDDAIPAQYMCQIQHYMAVTEATEWWVACLIGGQRYVERCVRRDEDFIRHMISEEQKFFDLVMTKQMPFADGQESTKDTLNLIFPQGSGAITLPEEVKELYRMRQSLKDQIDENKQTLDSIDNRIKQMIGSNEVGICDDIVVKWTNFTKKEYIVKEQSGRKFTITRRTSK